MAEFIRNPQMSDAEFQAGLEELVSSVRQGVSVGEGLGDEIQSVRSIYGEEIADEVERTIVKESK